GRIESFGLHLQALERRIDETRHAPGRGLLAEHVPGLERLPQFESDAAARKRSEERKSEFALRFEPRRIETIAGGAQVREHIEEVRPHEVRKHEAVVQSSAPAHERSNLRVAPEGGDQRAKEKLLRETHARIGRHFKRAKLDEAQASSGA